MIRSSNAAMYFYIFVPKSFILKLINLKKSWNLLENLLEWNRNPKISNISSTIVPFVHLLKNKRLYMLYDCTQSLLLEFTLEQEQVLDMWTFIYNKYHCKWKVWAPHFSYIDRLKLDLHLNSKNNCHHIH